MGGELTHPDAQPLLGAYALDAVDLDESGVLEAHLRVCPRCRSEVEEFREVASWMALSGRDAPPKVWSRIAASLEEAPPRLTLAPVVPLRRSVSMRVALMFAAAAAVVIGLLGVKVVQGKGDVAAPPSARLVAMVSPDHELSADAVLLSDGNGYLVRSNLPPLKADRTYQLWALVGTNRISAGILGARSPGLSGFKVAGDVWGLAITEESAGGVSSTQNTPLVVGDLRGQVQ